MYACEISSHIKGRKDRTGYQEEKVDLKGRKDIKLGVNCTIRIFTQNTSAHIKEKETSDGACSTRGKYKTYYIKDSAAKLEGKETTCGK
jgi:hypothetical protein